MPDDATNEYDYLNVPKRTMKSSREYFTGSGVASQVITLAQIPMMESLVVQIWTDVSGTSTWTTLTKDTDYAVSGTGEDENRTVTLWGTWYMPTAHKNIKALYDVRREIQNVYVIVSDIEIGGVELKNYNTDDRQFVNPGHSAQVNIAPAIASIAFTRNAANYITNAWYDTTDGTFTTTITRNASNYITDITTTWA